MRHALLAAVAACHGHAHVERGAIDAPMIVLVVEQPGTSAETMETEWAVPIEAAIATAPHIAHVHTRTRAGSARVEVELDGDADPSAAIADIAPRLPLPQLPATAQPRIERAPAREPVLHYIVKSDTFTSTQVRELQDSRIRPRLTSVPGVFEVETCGGAIARWTIAADPAALAAAGLTASDVAAALRTAVRSLRAGEPASAHVLADVAIATRNGANIRVSDVAKVVDDARPAPCRAVDEHGPVVAGTIRALRGASLRDVRDAATRALGEIRATLPPGMTLEVVADPAWLVVAGEPANIVAAIGEGTHFVIEQGEDVDWPSLDGDTSLVLVPRDREAAVIAAVRRAALVVHDRDEVVIEIAGIDRTQLVALARSAKAAIEATRNLAVTGSIGMTARSWLEITPDRAKVASLNIDARDLADVIRASSEGGLEVGEGFVGSRAVSIVVSVADPHGEHSSVRSQTGSLVPISAISRSEVRSELAELRREDRIPWVGLVVHGSPDAVTDAMKRVAMPAGCRWSLAASAVP